MPSSSKESCEKVAGVWTRLFEEDPLGDEENADRTTLVLWTQVPKSGIYVDIRLPKNSPGRHDTACGRTRHPAALRATRGSFSDKDDDLLDLDILTRQKSFAGVLTYQLGDTTCHNNPPGQALAKDKILADISKDGTAALPLCTCFWKRDIDYQPPTGGLDIGVCASYSAQTHDGAVDMRETGEDGSYAEGWRRTKNTHQGPFMALELMSENGHDLPRKGFWVRTGHRFAYAIGRPESVQVARALGCHPESATVASQVGKNLAQVVESMDLNGVANKEQKLAVIGSYVAVAGEILTEKHAWRIMESTNPGLVGCHLIGEDFDEDDSCCSVLQCDHGKKANVGDIVEQIVRGEDSFVRKWKVVELDGCSVPFLK